MRERLVVAGGVDAFGTGENTGMFVLVNEMYCDVNLGELVELVVFGCSDKTPLNAKV